MRRAHIDVIVEQLRTELAHLEAGRDELNADIDRVRRALAALDDAPKPMFSLSGGTVTTGTVTIGGPIVVAATEPVVPTQAGTRRRIGVEHAKPTKKKQSAGHTCPTCGDTLPTARGLAIHTSLKHKATDAAAAPAPAVKSGEKVLACGECDYEVPIGKVGDLNRHCLAEHHRTATPTERTPVVAA